MQGLLEFTDNESSYPTACRVRRGDFEPFVSRLESRFNTTDCRNDLGVNIITCSHPYKEEFVDEVGGLALDTKLHTILPEIPHYIPIIDYRGRVLPALPDEYPVVGVILSDILQGGSLLKAGMYREQRFEIRENILKNPAFTGKKVILFLTGTDTLIEHVWRYREPKQFFASLAKMGFWAVSGFNFSVFEGECPFSQALNQKRSLASSLLSEQHGLQAIPHVYALTDHHIERWCKWFQDNPHITTFTTNAQMQKSDKDAAKLIHATSQILASHPHLKVMLQGFRLNRIQQFGNLLERIHFAEAMAVKCAQVRKKIVLNNQEGRIYTLENSTRPASSLLIENVTARRKLIA